jgi:RimJ/RimL family protein N-acetyltransferase
MILQELNLKHNDELRIIYEIRSNSEIDKWLVGDPPKSFEEHKKYIINRTNEKFYIINELAGLFSNHSYTTKYVPIGYCSYIEFYDEIEIGLKIIPKWQNRGYGSEALQKLLEIIGFGRKIVLGVFENNERAIHLYKKFGFSKIEKYGNIIKMGKCDNGINRFTGCGRI